MKFIDLFAGLGGFHQALSRQGGECVFASELNSDLRNLYEKNFGILPVGDIRKIDPQSIPDHDILCAGFPCQPFSKAGSQKGLDCPQWGNLFDYVADILEKKKPQYFILENVPNLMRHRGGETWQVICNQIRSLGYEIAFERLSPDMFGIPQKRERAFIVGDRQGLVGFDWRKPKRPSSTSIHSILESDPPDAQSLSKTHLRYIKVWQQFIAAFPKNEELPTFPIWAMEFGANYPLSGATPHKRGYRRMGSFRGSLGQPLQGLSPMEVRDLLPGYARTELDTFPDWKIDFIQKNRELYFKHKIIIDPWIEKIRDFPPSFQKLEWNCKGAERNIWKHILQFRASGIRVKKVETAPSLVAMTTSQVPILAWQKRYMTPRECSRLQGMGSLEYLPSSRGDAYKALGNAVNVDVVEHIVDCLMNRNPTGDLASIAVAAE